MPHERLCAHEAVRSPTHARPLATKTHAKTHTSHHTSPCFRFPALSLAARSFTSSAGSYRQPLWRSLRQSSGFSTVQAKCSASSRSASSGNLIRTAPHGSGSLHLGVFFVVFPSAISTTCVVCRIGPVGWVGMGRDGTGWDGMGRDEMG